MPDGGWISTHEDITERCKSLEQIAFLAKHDPLTRLPNRVLFQERLEAGLRELGGSQSIALLCLDLDQFKMVNDTLGHPIGDQLLIAVAERIRSTVRKDDTVARLGGDEFAIVQRGVESEDDASALAGRIIRVVSKPYDLDCHRVSVGVSIGIAMAPGDGRQRQELLRKADLALYSAKQQGRGTWRLFQPALDDVVQGRRKMEHGLRQALRANQLELYYQPVVNTRTRRLTGFEGLLRWNHPTRGMVPPNEFIPAAEETGLIIEIGAWVIEQACAQAVSWPQDLSVAVNLSAVQFRGDLVRTVVDALDAHGLAPDRLVLEITELVLLQQNQSTLSTLHVLRGLGVPNCDGRLWDWLFVAVLSAQLPVRYHQDRSVVRSRAGNARRMHRHHPRRRRPGQKPAHAHDRGRCRDAGATRNPRARRLFRGPGLLFS